MTARTPEAVAALREAADLCDRLSEEVAAALCKGRGELLSIHDPIAVANWIAEQVRALADAPDPLEEAREIVDKMEPLSITFSDGDRFECVFLVSDSHLALRRALGMDEDHE